MSKCGTCHGSNNRYEYLREMKPKDDSFSARICTPSGYPSHTLVRCECGRFWWSTMDYNGFAFVRVPKVIGLMFKRGSLLGR